MRATFSGDLREVFVEADRHVLAAAVAEIAQHPAGAVRQSHGVVRALRFSAFANSVHDCLIIVCWTPVSLSNPPKSADIESASCCARLLSRRRPSKLPETPGGNGRPMMRFSDAVVCCFIAPFTPQISRMALAQAFRATAHLSHSRRHFCAISGEWRQK